MIIETMSKRGKPLNGRRVAIAHLRQLKSWAGDMMGYWEWAGRSTVYLGRTGGTRQREAHEYPEASPKEWHAMHQYALAIQKLAGELALYAAQQYEATGGE